MRFSSDSATPHPNAQTYLRGDRPAQLVGSRLFSDETWEALSIRLGLRGRLLEVLRGVFDDKTETAIAIDLGISCHTAHTYWERVRRRLAAHTRVGVVLAVLREFQELQAHSFTDSVTAGASLGSRAPASRGAAAGKGRPKPRDR